MRIVCWDEFKNQSKTSAQDPSYVPTTTTEVVADKQSDIKKPSLYKVMLHNDDYTPMDFVVMVLETFFSKDRPAANEIMMAVHTKGAAACGVYTFEIAETKVASVLECAREHEHPLQCTLEKV